MHDRRAGFRYPGPRVSLLAALVVCLAPRATAQRSRATPCDRVASASFEFGTTAGNLRHDSTRIATDGIITRRNRTTWIAEHRRATADEVQRAARLAVDNGFYRLPTAPTRPTRNPDAARAFITIRSACGTKHVELVPEDAPPAFRDLLAKLQAITR